MFINKYLLLYNNDGKSYNKYRMFINKAAMLYSNAPLFGDDALLLYDIDRMLYQPQPGYPNKGPPPDIGRSSLNSHY
jgi:hypothetical protein